MSVCKSRNFVIVSLIGLVLSLTVALQSQAQNIRGSMTGPTTAKGYTHPDQFITVQDVAPADNMYPVVPHPDQDGNVRCVVGIE
jgi:hypothetical protein